MCVREEGGGGGVCNRSVAVTIKACPTGSRRPRCPVRMTVCAAPHKLPSALAAAHVSPQKDSVKTCVPQLVIERACGTLGEKEKERRKKEEKGHSG